MSELKAVDCNGNELKVGDTVEIRCLQGSSTMERDYNVGDRDEIIRLHSKLPCEGPETTLVQLAGSGGSQYARRFELVESKPCCTLQEAADLLEAQGIQVDRKQLENVLNPRPRTLPAYKIRIGGCIAPSCLLVNVGSNVFQVVSSTDHNRLDDNRLDDIGGLYDINLDALESKGYVILDTWSPDTEFPELLDGGPELLES